MEVHVLRALARVDAGAMAKVDVVESENFLCGLNCFGPGQEHKPHVHRGMDKLYYVLEGAGEFSLGEETRVLRAGELLHVPPEVSHGVRNTSAARLVVLAVLAPNPKGGGRHAGGAA